MLVIVRMENGEMKRSGSWDEGCIGDREKKNNMGKYTQYYRYNTSLKIENTSFLIKN